MRVPRRRLIYFVVAVVGTVFIQNLLHWQDIHVDTQTEDVHTRLPGYTDLHDNNNHNTALDTAINKHTQDCPHLTPPEPQTVLYKHKYWQQYKDGDDDVFIISGFYDDRPIVGSLPYIRILAVAKPTKSQLYCQVWYADHRDPYVVPVEVLSSGRGEKIKGVQYGQFQYSCILPVSHPEPSHVSVVTGDCKNGTTYLPVVAPVRSPDWQHDFGICVAIAFGNIPILRFVEWMELNLMFGVTEVNIYDGNISSSMWSVFEYYIQKHVLNVIPMPPPSMDLSKRGVKLSSPASLNDCMLRNMYRYKYIIVIDFDELIVPRMHANYSSMLKAIDTMKNLKEPSVSYTFRNVYFFNHFQEDLTQPESLHVLRFRHRAKPEGHLFAPKSFIDPRTCLSVFNHYCWKRFASTGKHFTVDVNTSIAMTHHYRECSFGQKCQTYTEQQQLDEVILQYKPELERRVKAVMNDLETIKLQ